jgi:hypothetical protein
MPVEILHTVYGERRVKAFSPCRCAAYPDSRYVVQQLAFGDSPSDNDAWARSLPPLPDGSPPPVEIH